MDDVSLSVDKAAAARSGLMRLHEAVQRREPGRPEAVLSPEELLAHFRAADPTRNGSCLPWLLRTYAAGGYRLEDLGRAYDTLKTFARLRGSLPNTDTIDGETRNPRKLGSHMTLASVWTAVAPMVEQEKLARDVQSEDENVKERVLAQSRVLHRSERMVVAVPMTEEASCWWGQGTQWCTAARKDNAFETYHRKAPLVVICLRKCGDLPAHKLQLYVTSDDVQFMDENDSRVSLDIIQERWEELEPLVCWAVGKNGRALASVPEPLRTEAMCLAVVTQDGWALRHVPEHLRTEAICLAAVGSNGGALECVPEPLRTEAICLVAVGSDGRALEYVPEHLCTEAICLAAVGSDGGALGYVPEHLCTEALCLVAVGSNGGALGYVPKRLRTEAICLTAVGSDGRALEYVPEHLCTEAMCLAAVGSNGGALGYVPKPLRTEALCLVAVKQYGRALEYVPEHLCTEAMCLAAVTQYGGALYYVPEPLRTEAMCLAAVKQYGGALGYVPEHLRTEALCLVAVTQYSRALGYVPEHLCTEALCLVAVGSNGGALGYVPKPLRTEALCLVAVGRHGGALYHVPEHLKENIRRIIETEPFSQDSASVTAAIKSHDLVLDELEDCMNESFPVTPTHGLVH